MTENPQAMFGDGAAYERMMGRWSRMAGRQFLDWLALPGSLHWLDVGCGNGAFTEEIVSGQKPAAVTGIDPSAGQIDFAAKRPGTRMADFHVGDSQSLPFDDQAYDVTTMALVIAFVPDPAKGASELFRVLRPGGTAAAYMWDLENFSLPLSPIYRALKDMGIPAPQPPSFRISDRTAMAGLWLNAGFEWVETQPITITSTFESFDDFWTSCTPPIGPHGKHVHALPEDQKKELIERLRAMLPAGPDGRISYESTANAVKGRRPG